MSIQIFLNKGKAGVEFPGFTHCLLKKGREIKEYHQTFMTGVPHSTGTMFGGIVDGSGKVILPDFVGSFLLTFR